MRDDPMRSSDRPSTVEGELVVSDRQHTDPAALAAAEAVRRMSEEGRSGKVTVSMSVEVQQYPEGGDLETIPPAAGQFGGARFGLILAGVLGILCGLFVASLSFVPDVAGFCVGVVVAAWVYSEVAP